MDNKRWTQYEQNGRKELWSILKFWENYIKEDDSNDFHGVVNENLEPRTDGQKHLVLTSRLVWTFSAACRILGDQRYKSLAEYFYRYLLVHFIDREFGGAYWELNADGSVHDSSKRIYGEAFTIYALSEYYRTFHDEKALQKAVKVYACLEEYAYDPYQKGYYEAFTRQWEYRQESQISNINPFLNTCKTMNTHLHLLEAYTNLYRVWKDDSLKNRLEEHIDVMINHILDNTTCHFRMYFDQQWHSQTMDISYGHDIEGSWLLWEAAQILGEDSIKEVVKGISIKMAEAVLKEGWHPDGGILYEADPRGVVNDSRSWWVQAEAVVGFFNAWQLTGDEKYLDAVEKVWIFIDRELVDHVHGGWFSYAASDNKKANRIDGWTCPYHNARMCMEIVERTHLRSQVGR